MLKQTTLSSLPVLRTLLGLRQQYDLEYFFLRQFGA